MNIRTGITRIIILIIWCLICFTFSLGVLYCTGPPFTYTGILLSLGSFLLSFYGVAVALLVLVNSTYPEAEQWWEPWELPAQITLWIAIFAGLSSMTILIKIKSMQLDMAYYFVAFIFPFVIILGNYIIFCWIKDGFKR